MPYTPTTPTLSLCDDLVDLLAAAWTPVAPDEVTRDYRVRLDVKDLPGRRVVIAPAGYVVTSATRGGDHYEHEVEVLTTHHYPDAGDPPRAWLDEEADFVHTRIVQGFRFTQGGPPSFNRNLWTLSSDVSVLNLERLEQQKLFWSLVTVRFQEYVAQ